MTIVDMLGQSITLTLLGMGVVFSFLIILIFVLKLVEKLVKALKLDVEEKKDAPVAPAVSAQPQSSSAVIAAIAAAVKEKQK